MHAITRIFVYLRVRCVDTVCNVHVVHALLLACNAAIPLTGPLNVAKCCPSYRQKHLNERQVKIDKSNSLSVI